MRAHLFAASREARSSRRLSQQVPAVIVLICQSERAQESRA